MTVSERHSNKRENGKNKSKNTNELTELLQSLLAVILAAVRTGSFGEYEARSEAERGALKSLDFSPLTTRLEENSYIALSQLEKDFDRVIEAAYFDKGYENDGDEQGGFSEEARERILLFSKFFRQLLAAEYENLQMEHRVAEALPEFGDDSEAKKRRKRYAKHNIGQNGYGRTHVVRMPAESTVMNGKKWVLSRKVDGGHVRSEKLRFSQRPDVSYLVGKTSLELPDTVDFMQLVPTPALDSKEGSTIGEVAISPVPPARPEPRRTLYATAHREAMWILYRRPQKPVRYVHYDFNASFGPQFDSGSAELSPSESSYYFSQKEYLDDAINRSRPMDDWLESNGLDADLALSDPSFCGIEKNDNEGNEADSALSRTASLLQQLDQFQKHRLIKFSKLNKVQNAQIGKPSDPERKVAKNLEKKLALIVSGLQPKQLVNGSLDSIVQKSMKHLFYKMDPLYRGTLLPGSTGDPAAASGAAAPMVDYTKLFSFNQNVFSPQLPQSSVYKSSTNR